MPATKTTKKEEEETPKVTTPAAKGKYFYAKGKRKQSVARVRLYKGTGKITVNDKALKEYFKVTTIPGLVKTPFKITGTENEFDVTVKVLGGGFNSQAEAIRHGISRGLVVADPANKTSLKKAGFLTRDARTKERKKYGLKRARKAPQFSKR